jgi:hypothetical protein
MKERDFPMSEQAITQADIDAVFPKVAQVVADALGCDLEDVKPKASLIRTWTPSRSTSSTWCSALKRASA